MAYGFKSMVDMAKSPAEIKEDMPAMRRNPTVRKVPVYPYGLCISFDEDTMAKLGMSPDDMPDVGDMIHLAAMASVTSCSKSERVDESGNKTQCCRIELQITHLATENEDEENEEMTQARRGRFYDKVQGQDDEAA